MTHQQEPGGCLILTMLRLTAPRHTPQFERWNSSESGGASGGKDSLPSPASAQISAGVGPSDSPIWNQTLYFTHPTEALMAEGAAVLIELYQRGVHLAHQVGRSLPPLTSTRLQYVFLLNSTTHNHCLTWPHVRLSHAASCVAQEYGGTAPTSRESLVAATRSTEEAGGPPLESLVGYVLLPLGPLLRRNARNRTAKVSVLHRPTEPVYLEVVVERRFIDSWRPMGLGGYICLY